MNNFEQILQACKDVSMIATIPSIILAFSGHIIGEPKEKKVKGNLSIEEWMRILLDGPMSSSLFLIILYIWTSMNFIFYISLVFLNIGIIIIFYMSFLLGKNSIRKFFILRSENKSKNKIKENVKKDMGKMY